MIRSSELILNKDGSIYHLSLKPGSLSDTIIIVGDQDRVGMVSKYFDSIEFDSQKREFRTCTGMLNGKRISVVSTGIGTDNIDIVINEVDALFNVDFKTREVKQDITTVHIIRIGTSGALRPELPIDSFLVSYAAIGFDGLGHFYKNDNNSDDLISSFLDYCENKIKLPVRPYGGICNSPLLVTSFDECIPGITITCPGFYGPQNRTLRMSSNMKGFFEQIDGYRYNDIALTNLEMETAGIYFLAQGLGHQAISYNALLANRSKGTFTEDSKKAVDGLIQYVLKKLT